MALPIRPNNPNNPIPNSPFYAPLNPFVNGPYFPVDLGAGIDMTSGATVPSLVNNVAAVISAGTGISVSTVGTDTTITNTGVTGLVAGSNITLSATSGVVTISAAGGGGGGSVTSVGTGVGLTGGPITSSGTISLATSGVAAGSYTNPNITVDAYGRITVAASGTASLTGLTGTVPVVITGSAPTLNVSVNAASTTAPGVVQLNNTTSSTSTTLALTAAQGKNLQDQINALAVTSNITLAGTIDGSTGNMSTVTTEGTAAGFTVGSPLPAPATGNSEYFVIVSVAGTMTPTGGSSTVTHVGDWFLSNGTAWQFLDVGPAVPAASTTTPGIVELATTAETQTGTDTTRAVTPAGAAATYIACSAYTAKGAILGASAASTPVALTVGTDGQILYACSTAASGLCWAAAPANNAIPCTCITGKGALVTGTAASTPTALTVGTNGQILYACSTAASGLCWAAPPSGAAQATPTVAGIVFGCTTVCGTALGSNALANGVAGGADNVAIGRITLCANTSGSINTAIGTAAMPSNTTGSANVAVGVNAAQWNTTGSNNVAVGSSALNCNSVGDLNTAVGPGALQRTTGSNNTGLGFGAGCLLTTGSNNVAIGPEVQVSSATGSCQLAVGYASGQFWLTGDSTKAIKPGAGIIDCAGSCGTAGQVLQSNGANAVCWGSVSAAAATPVSLGTVLGCTLATNTAIGCNAMLSRTGGSVNVAVGDNALCAGVASVNNVAIGACALKNFTSNGNVAVGNQALQNATTGAQNVALGNAALCGLTTGVSNVAIGLQAMRVANGCTSVAIGTNALCKNTGFFNVAVGNAAAQNLTSGCSSAIFGSCAGFNLDTGGCNTLLGASSGLSLVTGSCNVFIGRCADVGSDVSCCLYVGIGDATPLTWITGDSTGAIKPAKGIIDCAASCGTAGQVLMSNGSNAVCWGSVSVTNATPTVAGIVFGCTTLDTGSAITALGNNALTALTTGINNSAVGADALAGITSGSQNVAIGVSAGYALTSESDNVVIGNNAGLNCGFCQSVVVGGGAPNNFNFASDNNVVVGYSALAPVTAGTSVSQSVVLGSCALQSSNWVSTRSVAIGPNITLPNSNGDCQLALGPNANAYWLTGCSNLSIKPGAGIIDCAGSCGTAGQVLTSTGSNAIQWAGAASPWVDLSGSLSSTTNGTTVNIRGIAGEAYTFLIGQMLIWTQYDANVGAIYNSGSNAMIMLNGYEGPGSSTVTMLNSSTGTFGVGAVLYPAYSDITVTYTPTVSTGPMNFAIWYLPYNGRIPNINYLSAPLPLF